MDDQENNRKPAPVLFEPGELEKTREHLGIIDLDEAKRMAKLLGGKVGIEKSAPVDSEKIKTVAANYRATRASHNTTKKHPVTLRNKTLSQKTNQTSFVKTNASNATEIFQKPKKRYHLPKWDSKNRYILNKLMSSKEYRIKPLPTIFTRILHFRFDSNEKITANYINITLKNNLSHTDKFIQSIKHLISIASDTTKSHIIEEKTWQDRTLHFISTWQLRDIKLEYLSLKNNANTITTLNMVNFTRSFYRQLIKLFFIGESGMTKLIKEIYAEIATSNPEKKEALLVYAKIAAAEWLYVYGQVIKGMYPLLMRMSSTEFISFPNYFKKKISEILTFLELTKYDLIFPIKDDVLQKQKQEIREKEEREKKLQKKAIEQKNYEVVSKSIAVLEKLFPEAGWSKLNTMPDMYPYFQPLYKFHDGFNLLPPSNPILITVVLLRILEDLFQACRYIKFSIEEDLDFVIENDSLQDIFATWSLYIEAILDRKMIPELVELVDNLHTKLEFTTSLFGKRVISNWLWHEKFYFLPYLSFELIFMEKPNKDEKYLPLPPRVAYLKRTFSIIIQRADAAVRQYENPSKAKVNFGATNLWEKYAFEVPNIVSHRLDILLGGKGSKHITNLNLLKYTLCVLNVLDWWINNEDSPAYKEAITTIYRKDSEGNPFYSVPLMTNQNKLFIQHVKSSVKKTE